MNLLIPIVSTMNSYVRLEENNDTLFCRVLLASICNVFFMHTRELCERCEEAENSVTGYRISFFVGLPSLWCFESHGVYDLASKYRIESSNQAPT